MTTYVLDASVLIGFARARRLEVLADVLRDEQVKTTPEVLDEVRNKASVYPEVESALALPWIETVQVSGLKAMGVYAEYAKRVGSSTTGNVGEATVLAWAECHGATAVIDEKVGRDAAKERGVLFKGSLGLIAHGIERRILSMPQATQLIDELKATGTHLPCSGQEFPAWANQRGLFGPAFGPDVGAPVDGATRPTAKS